MRHDALVPWGAWPTRSACVAALFGPAAGAGSMENDTVGSDWLVPMWELDFGSQCVRSEQARWEFVEVGPRFGFAILLRFFVGGSIFVGKMWPSCVLWSPMG